LVRIPNGCPAEDEVYNVYISTKKRFKADEFADLILTSPTFGDSSDSTRIGKLSFSNADIITNPLSSPCNKLNFSIKSFMYYNEEPYDNSAFVSNLPSYCRVVVVLDGTSCLVNWMYGPDI